MRAKRKASGVMNAATTSVELSRQGVGATCAHPAGVDTMEGETELGQCEVCEHDRLIIELGGKPTRMLRLTMKDASYVGKQPCVHCNDWKSGETDCPNCPRGNKTYNQTGCELCQDAVS